MASRSHPEEDVTALQAQLAYTERLKRLMNRVHAAQNIDQLLINMQDDMLNLFEAEHLTLYAVDYEKRELYSRFLDLDSVQEIRLALNEHSIAGFVARSKQTVNLADAYDSAELSRIHPGLRFDRSWDEKTGIRTRQVLTVPVCGPHGALTGVLQLLNKKSATRFSPHDERKSPSLPAPSALRCTTSTSWPNDSPTSLTTCWPPAC